MMIMLVFTILVILLISDISSISHDAMLVKNMDTIEISVMMDSSVSLPCNMTSNIPGDSVRLVLWFREDKMTPVYSLDSRGMLFPCGAQIGQGDKQIAPVVIL